MLFLFLIFFLFCPRHRRHPWPAHCTFCELPVVKLHFKHRFIECLLFILQTLWLHNHIFSFFRLLAGTFIYNIDTKARFEDKEARHIDPNHTHYIMIENSKNVGDKHPEYIFRRDLEQYISLYGKRMGSENEMVVGDLCVPSVVVVLEGGYGSLLKVSCTETRSSLWPR